VIRFTLVGLRTHLLYMSRSVTTVLFTIATPVLYSLIAIYLSHAATHPARVIQASVAAGLMGIWSSVLFQSGTAFQRQRRLGVLELIVGAPTPILLALFPITLATAVIGAYAMATTVFCAVVFFGASITPFLSPLFLAAVLVCIVTLGFVGVLMACSFIMLRNAYALVNTLEHPIWMLSGMMVPLSALPGWLHPLSWLLPSMWGTQAVRDSVVGGPVAVPITIALGTGATYLALAVFTVKRVERRALALATLTLA